MYTSLLEIRVITYTATVRSRFEFQVQHSYQSTTAQIKKHLYLFPTSYKSYEQGCQKQDMFLEKKYSKNYFIYSIYTIRKVLSKYLYLLGSKQSYRLLYVVHRRSQLVFDRNSNRSALGVVHVSFTNSTQQVDKNKQEICLSFFIIFYLPIKAIHLLVLVIHKS